MILNLTQHLATPEQLEAGVVEPADKNAVKELLTFHEAPSTDEIVSRAEALVAIAKAAGADAAMIGGAPYLMGALELGLNLFNIRPCYSFTKRISIDETQADGSIKKVSVFRHETFIYV